MHLVPAYFDPQPIKGEIVQYCKGLIASIKNNHVLVQQLFHSVSSGDKDLEHHLATWRFHLFQPGDFIYRKQFLQKDSPQLR